LFFLGAVGSQAHVQLVRRGTILYDIENSPKFTMKIADVARRGSIYSSDGKPLARDDGRRGLQLVPSRVPRSDAFFAELGAASGIPATELEHAAYREPDSSDKGGAVDWWKPLSPSQARAVLEVKALWRANGLSLVDAQNRQYPLGEPGISLVGSIRRAMAVYDPKTKQPKRDAKGKVLREDRALGLEAAQDELLRGKDGSARGMIDRSGHLLPMRMDGERIPRQDGRSIVLTVDSELQTLAYEAVKEQVLKFEAERGSAVVMDPKTGDILAIVCFRNPNAPDTVEGSDFNAAVMGRLDPGSTFKVFTLAKALDCQAIGNHTTRYCSGTLPVEKRIIHCDEHHGTRAHGVVDPEKALAKSCNTTAASWALAITRKPFLEYLESMGLFKKPGVGAFHENRGFYDPDEYAKTLQTAQMGFGQAVTVTPLGMAAALCAIGNEGVKMKPRLIKKIGSEEQPVLPGATVLGADAAEKTLECMESVIEEDFGTGKFQRIPGYRLGGKTGTAQRRNRLNGSMVGGGYCSNFIGFVPSRKPRAAIVVMVEGPNPSKGKYGSTVSGPAFTKIARGVIRKLSIPPEGNAQ
jgi:cell division protein FtsI/penicillin-binding protein 2